MTNYTQDKKKNSHIYLPNANMTRFIAILSYLLNYSSSSHYILIIEDYFVFMFLYFVFFEGNKVKQGKLKDIKLIVL